MIVASIRWSQDIGWLLICQIGRLFNPLMEMLSLRRSYGKHKCLRRFIIMWKTISRSLPTGSNLKWRHVTTHIINVADVVTVKKQRNILCLIVHMLNRYGEPLESQIRYWQTRVLLWKRRSGYIQRSRTGVRKMLILRWRVSCKESLWWCNNAGLKDIQS